MARKGTVPTVEASIVGYFLSIGEGRGVTVSVASLAIVLVGDVMMVFSTVGQRKKMMSCIGNCIG